MTVYHYNLRRKLRNEPKEGLHRGERGAIFFKYYSVRELKDLVQNFFYIRTLHPIDIALPFFDRLRVPKKVQGVCSRVSERIPVINKLGHLLVMVGQPIKHEKI